MTPNEAGRIVKSKKIESVTLHPDGTSTLSFVGSEDSIRTNPYWQDQHYRGKPGHHGWYVMLENGSEWWHPVDPLPPLAEPKLKPADPFAARAEAAVDHHLGVINALIGVTKNLPQSRELSLYRTKLEEAQMWLLKHKEN